LTALAAILSCLSRLVILIFYSPYLGSVLPLFVSIIYFLQKPYLRTARQVRLLSIEAKAPLFTSFIDSVAGATTIRAFGWQNGYQRRIHTLIDQFQRPEYVQSCLLYWLTFVLDIVLAIVALLLVAAIVYWPASFAEGNVGVSLLMMIGFSRTVMNVGTTWATMESSMGAVSRIKAFTEETPKEAEKYDGDAAWLHLGHISFEDLEVAHTPDGHSVLRVISLAVEPKQHIAICGRTGSGKTSLLLSILDMALVRKGTIIIDGIDLKSLAPEQLRKAINVVPQDPFIIPHSSVRANVDPFGYGSEDEIERVLRRVGLWDQIVVKGGPDEEMVSSEWSAGQKQLVCFARAIMRKSKLVILDEAMSVVDAESEALMQDIIDTEFRDVTVLAIMHRLKYVTRYDKVALLDGGELVEFDGPRTLLSRDGSMFAALHNSSEM
jgi:ABC-type multidrug transport system fused ATPase/permease subunit